MKLRCNCGEILSDVNGVDPNVGQVVWWDTGVNTYEALESEINAFINSICESRRDEWVKRMFAVEISSNLSVVWELIERSQKSFEVLRCTKCGRIHLQNDDNTFRCYTPEEYRKPG